MNQIQYAFCAAYMVLSLLLIACISARDTEEKNTMYSEQRGTYYARNIRKSREARKERLIKGSAVLFAAMNLAAMFVL